MGKITRSFLGVMEIQAFAHDAIARNYCLGYSRLHSSLHCSLHWQRGGDSAETMF